MRATRTGLVFLSGCAVYAAMAACSGGVMTSATSSGTASGSTTSSGAGGTGGSSVTGSTSTGGMGGLGATGTGGSGGVGGTSGGKTTSGSRLKRMFGLGDDGTTDLDMAWIPWVTPATTSYAQLKPTTQWWDSERQEVCAFQVAADGMMRCLPLDTDNAFGGTIVYYDAHCTQPATAVLGASPGCQPPPPKYAISYDTPVCPVASGMAPVHLYPVGALLGSSTCFHSGPSCTSGCSNQPFVFYAVGAEVAPASFVAGAPAKDP